MIDELKYGNIITMSLIIRSLTFGNSLIMYHDFGLSKIYFCSKIAFMNIFS